MLFGKKKENKFGAMKELDDITKQLFKQNEEMMKTLEQLNKK